MSSWIFYCSFIVWHLSLHLLLLESRHRQQDLHGFLIEFCGNYPVQHDLLKGVIDHPRVLARHDRCAVPSRFAIHSVIVLHAPSSAIFATVVRR